MKLNLMTALGAVLCLPACATITRGTTQQFTVQSEPPGAQVSTSNGFQCAATPCTFRMSRKDPFRVTVSLEGYQTEEREVTTGMSSNGTVGLAGNVIFGGIVGGAVDVTSGALNDLTPNPLIVILQPEGASAPQEVQP